MSRPIGPGQPAFLHGCCGELQRGEDISPVQVREVNNFCVLVSPSSRTERHT
jgi:hypothetical protein